MSDQPLPFYTDCVVCGTTPTSMKIRFHRTDDGTVFSNNFVFPSTFQGFTGVIHGGSQSAVLDEASMWAAALASGDYTVTQELTVKFMKTVRTDMPYNVRGRILSRDGNSLIAESEITDDAGKAYTSLRGIFKPMPSKLSDRCEATVTYPADASNDWRRVHAPTPPTS